MYLLRNFVYLWWLMSATNVAADILSVFPSPSTNHQTVFRSLTYDLVTRGHKNVILTTDPAYPKGNTPENLTEIDINVQDASYKTSRQKIFTKYGDINDFVKQIGTLMNLYLNLFEKQTGVAEVRDIIENRNNSFDLLLVESWVRFALSFSCVVKGPVIAVSSFDAVVDNYYVMGATPHPLLYPQASTSPVTDQPLFQRLIEYCYIFSILIRYKHLEEVENVIVRRIFGENTPPLSQMQNNIDMLFINIYRLWEGCRPMPLSVVHLGGIHLKPEKELPQDLKEYLDSSPQGVIYLSFGSNSVDLSVLPPEKIQAILKVLSQLPYNVLWKWDDELPGLSENVRISKWFPQPDLLKHPNMKLFITHGGQQSADEAIDAGVPVVCIPMFGDQFTNARKYEYHKLGKRLYLSDLNEETLMSVIRTVVDDKSYRDNMVRLRSLVTDQPTGSLRRAVWWTEYVAKHGGRHLRSPAADITWTEYYELKLVFIAISIATATVITLLLILRKFVKLIANVLNTPTTYKKA